MASSNFSRKQINPSTLEGMIEGNGPRFDGHEFSIAEIAQSNLSYFTDKGLMKRIIHIFHDDIQKVILDFLEKRGDVTTELTWKDFVQEIRWFSHDNTSYEAEAEYFLCANYWSNNHRIQCKMITLVYVVSQSHNLVKPKYWSDIYSGYTRLNITHVEKEILYRLGTVKIRDDGDIAALYKEDVEDEQSYEYQALFSIDVKHEMPPEVTSMISTVENLLRTHLAPTSMGGLMVKVIRRVLIRIVQATMVKDGYVLYYLATTCLDLIADFFDDSVFEYLTSMYESLRHLRFNSEEDDVAMLQGNFEMAPEGVVSLLGTALTGVLTLGAEMPKTRIFKVIKAFGELGKSLSGLSTLYDWVAKIGQKFVNLLIKYVTGEDPEKKEINELIQNYNTFEEDFKRLNNIEGKDLAKTSPMQAAEYRQLINIAMKIESRMMDLKLPQPRLTDLRIKINRLRSIYEEIAQSGIFSAGSRVEPVVVYLHGAPNCGKSFVVQYIASVYLKKEGITTDDPWKYMYKYNPDDDFMSGYTGQPIFLMDDFGQKVDSRQAPNPEIMNLIFAANVAPMPLNMAALSDKGTSYFNSPLIIITSNTPKPYVISITEPDALYRRIAPFHFEVRPAPQFRKQIGSRGYCLDVSKIRGVDLGVYEFVATEVLPGHSVAPPGTIMNFPAFMNFLHNEVSTKSARNKEAHATFKNMDFAALCERIPPMVRAPNGEEAPLPRSEVADYEDEEDYWSDAEAEDEALEFQMLKWMTTPIKAAIRAPKEANDVLSPDINEVCEELFGFYRDKTITFDVAREQLGNSYLAMNLTAILREERNLGLIDFVQNHPQPVAKLLSHCRDDKQSLFWCIKTSLAENSKNPLRLFLIGLSGAIAVYVGYKAMTTVTKKLYDVAVRVGRSEAWKIPFPTTQEEVDALAQFIAAAKVGTQNDRDWLVFFMSTELIESLLVECEFDDSMREFFSDFPLQEEMSRRGSNGKCRQEATKLVGAIKSVEPKDFDTLLQTYNGIVVRSRALQGNMLQNYAGPVVRPVKYQGQSYSGMTIKPMKLASMTLVDQLVFPEDNGYGNVARVVAQMAPKLTDRSHSILPNDGNAHEHSHFCEVCGGIFIHSHKKNSTVEDASKHAHVCRDCKNKNPGIEMKAETAVYEGADDIGLTQVRFSLLSNMYSIFVDDNTKDKPAGAPLMQGLFIKGRIMLVPQHIRAGVRDDKYFKLVGGNDVMLIFPCSSVKWHPVQDNNGHRQECWLMECPASVHSHRDITNLIATQEDHTSRTEGDAHLVSLSYSRQGRSTAILQFTHFRAQTDIKVSKLTNEKEYEYVHGYRYAIPTKSGDCGAVLFESSRYKTRRLIGMHVAGRVNVNTGISERIQIDWLEKAMANVDFKSQIAQPLRDDDLVQDVITFDSQGNTFGVYDPAPAIIDVEGLVPVGTTRAVRSPTETDYVPSVFHGLVAEVTQKPAHLTPIGDIDPLKKGIKKLVGTNLYIDDDLLDDVAQAIIGEMAEGTNLAMCKVYDIHTACYGDTAVSPYLTGLNRKTSPGFPYVFDAKGVGKSTWIGPAEDPWISPKLIDDVQKRIDAAKEGNRTWTVYVDTLKDETRPIAKVDEGKTRVFAVGPLDHTVASKMYFMGFCAHVMENRIYNEIALGIDVHSAQWNDLAMFLRHKDRVIAGDIENFDGSLCRQILEKVGDVIIAWYDIGGQTEEERRIRTVLFNEVINAYHNCRGRVYQSTHSQTSGNILTTIINCLFLKFVCRLAFVEAGGLLSEFKKMVALCTYGDDNILAVSEAAPAEYNQRGLTKIFARFGLTYTDEAKSGREFEFRKLTEVEFLKRSFRFSPEYGRWVGPLRLDVLTNMMDWQKKKMDPIEQMRTNFEVLQKELTYHPEDKMYILEQYAQLFRKHGVAVEVRNRKRLILDLMRQTYSVNTPRDNKRDEEGGEAVVGDELDY